MSVSNYEPLVSVVMPIYNADNYLEESLYSVLEQSYKNLQIICVDDGSTDKSSEILDKFKNQDSRISIIHKNNEGAGVARNVGMSKAEGKYIYFFDADDYLKKNAIKVLVKTAEKNSADIVLFGYYKFNDKKKIKIDYSPKTLRVPLNKAITPKSISDRLYQADHGMPWNKFYKLDFVRETKVLFQDLKNTNDEYFSRITTIKAKHIVFINKTFVGYRVGNKGSLQGSISQNILACTYAVNAIKDELITGNYYDAYSETFKILIGYIIMIKLMKADQEAFNILADEITSNTFKQCEMSEKYLDERFIKAYMALEDKDYEKARKELELIGRTWK